MAATTIEAFAADHPLITVEKIDWPGPIAYLPAQRTVVISSQLTTAETAAALTAVEQQLEQGQ